MYGKLCLRLAAAIAVAAVGAGADRAAAHDFWVQPEQFWAQPDAVMPLTLQVGHGPLRQRSPIARSRITRFQAFGPDGATVDIRDGLMLGGATADGRFQFRLPGAYVLVLETDNRAQSHLPAIRFNDYLQVEGLTPALEQRQRTHRMDTDGSESYSRIAKSIVRVGDSVAGAAPDEVTHELGLTLEIVLERDPYAQPRAATLPARVVYEGRPLEGALLKLTDLDHDASPYETHVTDHTGHATFAMPAPGRWLLNVIWTKPLPSSEETDFATVFSSLSFGVPSASRPTRGVSPAD